MGAKASVGKQLLKQPNYPCASLLSQVTDITDELCITVPVYAAEVAPSHIRGKVLLASPD
jgi:hypothetical protein